MKHRIAEKLLSCRRIAISSHVRPDADSIGSGLALALMLKELGKEVHYRNIDPAPHPLQQLPGYDMVEYRQVGPTPFDAVVLIEGATEERTGQKKLSSYFTINIDHHATSSHDAELNWVDPEAAAVGELIFELAGELGVEFTHDIAFNLYAAIASDTGSFRYSNTSYQSLAIAAELVLKGGFSPCDVGNLLFNSNPPEKIHMMTKVLSTLDFALDNRVAMIEFRRSFLAGMTLREIETEDIIAVARSVAGVQCLLFFKEIEDQLFRVSVRSRDHVSAQRIAQTFAGGGHHHAAGFFYHGDLERGKEEILTIIHQQIL